MKQSIGPYVAVFMFTLFGLGCGVIGIIFGFEGQHLQKNGIETMGMVTDLSYSHRKGNELVAPVISYTTQTGEARRYTSNYYTNISPSQIGDKVRLWYDPAHPEKIYTEKTGMPYLSLLLVFFLVFGGIGTFGFISLIRQRRMYKLLRERGLKVEARIVEIRGSIRDHFRIVALWTDPKTKIQHTLKSDHISKWLLKKAAVDMLIPVIINPEDPRQCWMDFSEFSKKR